MNNRKAKSLYTTQAGVIAALYVALTWVSNIIGLSYGSIQFRLSELLTILPVFTPAAIPGLTVGCALANLSSPYGLLDIALGSLATLIASVLVRCLRDIQYRGLPLLSALMPVWANALAVSLVISPFFSSLDDGTLIAFAISFAQVGLGELVTGTFLGLILYSTLKKHNFGRLLKEMK